MNEFKILAINPGSTSTKVAIFEDEKKVFTATVRHSADEIRSFPTIQDQLSFRAKVVKEKVAESGFELADIDVFAGRGGGTFPLEGGTYRVTELLADHASKGMSGHHPAQLASQICKVFADEYGGDAFVVNPPDVDEFEVLSRITGLKGIYRESHVHALNQKEAALRFCNDKGYDYNEINLIVCHLGGGISITAHKKGRMVDSNDVMRGTGPMTPTRAGDLPYLDVVDLAYSGEYTKKQLIDRLNKSGGFTDIFGTSDGIAIRQMADEGDEGAKIIYEAMNYQISKYIGAMAAALKGDLKAIILTGGLARDEVSVAMIREHVSWIGQVVVMAGEFELEAIASGALRAMRKEEDEKIYTGKPIWTGL